MNQHLTPSDIANTVRMVRTLHRGTVLIVEGDTDCRVYGRLADEYACKTVPAFGKDNAIEAILILERAGIVGVLAIVDSDFWRLDSVCAPSPNVLSTDSHDLETMIVQSTALDHLLNELCSPRQRGNATRIRQSLIKAGLPVGHLRWLSGSTKQRLNLKFDGLDFNKFVRTQTFATDIPALIKQVISNSGTINVDERAVTRTVIQMLALNYDAWQVCCGHDLVALLGLGLASGWGNAKARTLSVGQLDIMLRLAYNFPEFCLSGLYQSILAWQQANPSFGVMRQPSSA